jgi:hypothetical protein
LIESDHCWASNEPNWVTTRIEEFIEESETGIDFEEEAVPSLSLFFDTTEFSALEIASIISQLSLLYKSISDDVLVIEGTTLFQPNTNPVGV